MNKRTRRSGFTLIELLVVVAIIGVLATLAIGATMRFIQGQKETNTRTIIQNVDKALQKQWAKVIADAKKEPTSNISSAVIALAGNDANRARVIWIKMRLAEAFPTSLAEIQSPLPYQICPLTNTPYIPAGRQKYNASQKKLLAGSTSNPASDSAVCLLIALSFNKTLDQDSIASNLGQDANGNKYIVDGWNNPVWFYRFPAPVQATWANLGGMDLQTSNPAQNTSKAKLGVLDPVDPDGLLLNPNWNNAANYKAPNGIVYLFEQICHPIHTGNYAPTSWYITPVIASGGSDGKFGLTPPAYDPVSGGNTNPNPFSVTSSTDAGDNIYNYLLRFGATGN